MSEAELRVNELVSQVIGQHEQAHSLAFEQQSARIVQLEQSLTHVHSFFFYVGIVFAFALVAGLAMVLGVARQRRSTK